MARRTEEAAIGQQAGRVGVVTLPWAGVVQGVPCWSYPLFLDKAEILKRQNKITQTCPSTVSICITCQGKYHLHTIHNAEDTFALHPSHMARISPAWLLSRQSSILLVVSSMLVVPGTPLRSRTYFWPRPWSGRSPHRGSFCLIFPVIELCLLFQSGQPLSEVLPWGTSF